MAEYIEREKALLDLMNEGCTARNIETVMKIPAADVVEVVHGEWIRHKENCLYNKCSICSYEHCREDNYCPNCGAKMDGEKL